MLVEFVMMLIVDFGLRSVSSVYVIFVFFVLFNVFIGIGIGDVSCIYSSCLRCISDYFSSFMCSCIGIVYKNKNLNLIL